MFRPFRDLPQHDGPRLKPSVLREVLERGIEPPFSYRARNVAMLSQIRRLVERAFDVGRNLPRIGGKIDLRPEETGARATEDAARERRSARESLPGIPGARRCG